MGERYLITGVQLAMFLISKTKQERKELKDDITDNQFIINTYNTDVVADAKKVIKSGCLKDMM